VHSCTLTDVLIGYVFLSLFSITRLTSFLTIGETTITVGNATINEKPHALSQMETMPSIKPTLKILITSDIVHDINNAIKNEKTYGVCFFGINFIYPSIGT
jgi:hypothetical protein